jgi:hypothetical protein
MNAEFSVEQAVLLMQVAGLKLRVAHADWDAALVSDPRPEFNTGIRIPISAELRESLIAFGGLQVAIKETVNNKLGWRECGYDGDVADWYRFIQ